MSYNFYRFVSIVMLCILAALVLFIMGSSLYFLHYRYSTNWIFLGIAAVMAVTAFHFLILKPLFLRISFVTPPTQLLKKFMKYGSSGYQDTVESIEIREDLTKRMRQHGANNFSKMNFSNLNLSGIDFRGVRFTYCLFIGANLSNVRFEKAFFEGCIFDNADLTNANFANATISGVSLNFENAIMINTCLDNIRIYRTLPYQERLEKLCLTELENNNVTGFKELQERYICSKGENKRTSSINDFLILPR
ncbi:pentapeptide repeat-containing protein [Ferruginibacter lapsinanis]|uniref:pentapeptide repeat-containing protein n=1 Tax=Ferruginibacter lapsinanis TaxID=563172 RepID=UPI001E5CBC33|nr:pentapeptide repeat-containing protein [Ferruginibacter lapsinanis]UEG49604.1 pentapeptide repeat-containing protein [Ferruginibacter lapsinanis]